MKNLSIDKACAALLSILFASYVLATGGGKMESSRAANYQERDEINKRFTLSSKARVDVSAISGSVDIKAIEGNTAIVQIERTGRSRADLDCNKVVLEHSAGNLNILSKTEGGRGCENIRVVYRVLLSVPRDVDVSVQGVSGPVNVGEIEGALRISGNSGNINLAQSGSGSRITGNSGTTTVKLRKLNASGLDLSGNSGAIKLYVGDGLNVDVKVSALSGTTSSELPNVKFNKVGAADYHARIGSGGPTVNVEGNSGSVSLHRDRE
ncbi:MAG TPA: DUF4097 family beta strand repeat-containing protein [Pyrinomonadaceae bacterium]|nr:DUF4097 family beta strand repeat-containing protein [Pyrinomonadaceae bacterium]